MMQEIKEWYDMAAMDLGVAKHLDTTYHPKPLEIICYHCQQSAEKVIKALSFFIYSAGMTVRSIRSGTRLLGGWSA